MKKWTEYELDSAFALETVNERRILPLWHGITHEELMQYSPALTVRFGLDSKKQSPTELGNELLILLSRRPGGAFPTAETVPVVEPESHATEEIIFCLGGNLLIKVLFAGQNRIGTGKRA